MRYVSTRDEKVSVSSAEAIVQGLSHEGGLFLPESIPSVSLDEIGSMASMTYNERAKKILPLFLTDFTAEEIANCVDSAYTTDNFASEKIAPVKKLTDETHVLELWHGPTCAFKDMALQILPYLLTTSMKKTGVDKEVVILVATSGDTGKAALEGFKDVEGTKIIVFYPCDGVSGIQKLQMCTQSGKNVYVAAVKGNFDDAQNGVKAIFTSAECEKKMAENKKTFSSANSINWGRLVPQIVYYFSAYADMLSAGDIELGEKINVCVPTGNFGNILAAYYAKCMGLPVNKLICASNMNNVLTDFIASGTYDKNRRFYTTISPSMDILISSNLERLLYLLSHESGEVAGYMAQLKESGKYTVSDAIKEKVTECFAAGCASDDEAEKTIGEYVEKFGYTPDTHTAVALNVYDNYVKTTGDKTKTVIASTASPFKFNAAVLSAMGEETEGKDEFALLRLLSERSGMKAPRALSELEEKQVRFADVFEKEKMIDAVYSFLNIE
ncbi:MAG: threonine synthase [Clostridia bacterium]|nr:threonine synthase [Clostridia bacterium]